MSRTGLPFKCHRLQNGLAKLTAPRDEDLQASPYHRVVRVLKVDYLSKCGQNLLVLCRHEMCR